MYSFLLQLTLGQVVRQKLGEGRKVICLDTSALPGAYGLCWIFVLFFTSIIHAKFIEDVPYFLVLSELLTVIIVT